MTNFEESLSASNSRIKSDIENCYNLTMRIKMSRNDSDQLEMLRELEQKLYKIHDYVVETVKTYQVEK